MGIGDPVVIRYDEKHGWYWLSRAGETFYDDDRYLIVFDTDAEAAEFARGRGFDPKVEIGGELVPYA